MHSHLARHVGQDFVAVVHLYPEHCIGQRLDHLTLHLDCVFLAHGFLPSPFMGVLGGRSAWMRAEMTAGARTRWLSRPGLAVTLRASDTCSGFLTPTSSRARRAAEAGRQSRAPEAGERGTRGRR